MPQSAGVMRVVLLEGPSDNLREASGDDKDCQGMAAGTLAERYGQSEYSDGGRMWCRICLKYLRVHFFIIGRVGYMNCLQQ